MSLIVDQFLLEQMRKDDDFELMMGNDMSGTVIDHIAGWDEEAGVYDRTQGMLFPQPIRKMEE